MLGRFVGKKGAWKVQGKKCNVERTFFKSNESYSFCKLFWEKDIQQIQSHLISENLDKSQSFTFNPTKKSQQSQKTKKEPTQIPDPTKRSLWNIVTLRLGSCFPEHKWRQNPIESVDKASKATTRCVSWGLATWARTICRLWTFF